MKNARHIVTVKRPSEGNLGALGQKQGDGEIIYRELPCAIDPVAGNESDVANQSEAVRTYTVQAFTDPHKPINEKDYLLWPDGYSPNPRVLQVSYAGGQPGLTAELICGEIT